MRVPKAIRSRQRLGKYRIERRLGRGGFGDVYRAFDTIEGIHVALKVPQPDIVSPTMLDDFRSEVRLTARLEHPNILPIKNADFVDGRFVIVYQLGDGSLADRVKRRVSLAKGMSFSEQVLAALAHAHSHRVMHGDVKPDNFILFGDHVRLSDFGISKVALRTLHASGAGTLGFMAPEQAMGRPSLRSDVFAAGLVLYRVLAGVVPAWPFEWPPPGFDRAQRELHPELLAVLERSLRVDPRNRYADCEVMLRAFRTVGRKALRHGEGQEKKQERPGLVDLRAVQLRDFRRTYQRSLAAKYACARCERPVSESMQACPWCSTSRRIFRQKTGFPAACPRCKRGVKLDWRYCPHCHGRGIGPLSDRHYTDKRYTVRCGKSDCRGELMPFMKYCPWCRSKVKRAWPIEGSRNRCPSCGWGVLGDYWKTCPWCVAPLGGKLRASHGRRR